MMGSYRTYARWEQRIVPGLRSSQFAYHDTIAGALHPGMRWLDAGCGHQLFPEWMVEQEKHLFSLGARVTGIDLDRPSLRRHSRLANKVLGDLTRLPFAHDSFDLISANMVVEHLEDPRRWLGEIQRVLAERGTLIIHTPNRLHWAIMGARLLPDALKRWLAAKLEQRASEDVFKTYYRLNSPEAIREFAAGAGLEVVSLTLVSGSAALGSLGFLAIPELLWIRLLRRKPFEGLRSNLVAVLRKPSSKPSQGVDL